MYRCMYPIERDRDGSHIKIPKKFPKNQHKNLPTENYAKVINFAGKPLLVR